MKKVEVFFLVALLILSVKTVGRADEPIWCNDGCNTAGVQKNPRCERKCEIKCSPGARG
ncbi:hypothetical protein AMTRI_Chr07g30990 [Amborella trichopoda]